MSIKINLVGQRFQRLTVKKAAGSDKWGQALWLCDCDCGGETTTTGGALRRGMSGSCGCLQLEKSIASLAAWNAKGGTRKHGESFAPEYSVWAAMLQRCNNPRHKRYADWGGRGITVCERWRDYRNFIADMGHRPSRIHSLDRIDNDGNYEPGNVRWATPKEQIANQRRHGNGGASQPLSGLAGS